MHKTPPIYASRTPNTNLYSSDGDSTISSSMQFRSEESKLSISRPYTSRGKLSALPIFDVARDTATAVLD